MAAVNVCSVTFGRGEFGDPPGGVRRVAARVRGRGVKAGLEICGAGHLDLCPRLSGVGLAAEPPPFSVGPGVPGERTAAARSLLAMVRRLPPGASWPVTATGRVNPALTAIGRALGGTARAGLEDTLYLRAGELAAGNPPLLGRAARLAAGRAAASAPQTAALLSPPPAA
jgi:uncharacterized protein (DUF849 family)